MKSGRDPTEALRRLKRLTLRTQRRLQVERGSVRVRSVGQQAAETKPRPPKAPSLLT